LRAALEGLTLEAFRNAGGLAFYAMRSINTRAGFKMHRRLVEYQVTRDTLDLWSSARAHSKLFIT
jgi:hypothetical protein